MVSVRAEVAHCAVYYRSVVSVVAFPVVRAVRVSVRSIVLISRAHSALIIFILDTHYSTTVRVLCASRLFTLHCFHYSNVQRRLNPPTDVPTTHKCHRVYARVLREFIADETT